MKLIYTTNILKHSNEFYIYLFSNVLINKNKNMEYSTALLKYTQKFCEWKAVENYKYFYTILNFIFFKKSLLLSLLHNIL